MILSEKKYAHDSGFSERKRGESLQGPAAGVGDLLAGFRGGRHLAVPSPLLRRGGREGRGGLLLDLPLDPGGGALLF